MLKKCLRFVYGSVKGLIIIASFIMAFTALIISLGVFNDTFETRVTESMRAMDRVESFLSNVSEQCVDTSKQTEIRELKEQYASHVRMLRERFVQYRLAQHDSVMSTESLKRVHESMMIAMSLQLRQAHVIFSCIDGIDA